MQYRYLPIGLVLLLFASANEVNAAIKTWTGGSGSSSNWNTGANWSGGTAPVAGDDLVFDGSTRLTNTNNFTAGTSFASITFNSSAGAFTITGNQITLTGGITNNSANAQNIGLPIVIAATRTITGTIYLNGNITGGGGLTTGGGDVILNTSGTNSIGPITVTNGRLFVFTINSINGSSINVQNGATVDFAVTGGASPSNTMTFASGACIANRVGTLTVSTANVTFPTAGTMIFNSDDQVTTAITVNGNYPSLTGDLTMQLGGSNASVGTITMTNGINGINGSNAYSLTKTLPGTLSFGTGSTVTLKGLTISAGTVTSTSGTMNLAGDFTNNGSFTHNSGTINFNGSPSQTISGTSATTFNNITINTSNGTVSLSANPSVASNPHCHYRNPRSFNLPR